MPSFVVNKVSDALNDRGKPVKGSQITLLGMAYKKDVDDPRESPGFELMDLLLKKGAVVSYHDPHIPVLPSMRHYPHLQMVSQELTAGYLRSQDCLVVVTDHSAYDWAWIADHAAPDRRHAERHAQSERPAQEHRTVLIPHVVPESNRSPFSQNQSLRMQPTIPGRIRRLDLLLDLLWDHPIVFRHAPDSAGPVVSLETPRAHFFFDQSRSRASMSRTASGKAATGLSLARLARIALARRSGHRWRWTELEKRPAPTPHPSWSGRWRRTA